MNTIMCQKTPVIIYNTKMKLIFVFSAKSYITRAIT